MRASRRVRSSASSASSSGPGGSVKAKRLPGFDLTAVLEGLGDMSSVEVGTVEDAVRKVQELTASALTALQVCVRRVNEAVSVCVRQ